MFKKEKNKEELEKNFAKEKTEFMLKIIPSVIASEIRKGNHLEDIIDNKIVNEKNAKGVLKSTLGEKQSEAELQVGIVATKIAIIGACKALKVLMDTETGRNEFADYIIKTGNELKEIKGDFEDYE